MTTDASLSMRSRGMRDLPPDEMRRRRLIEDAFRLTCDRWGYEEIRTPVIEPLHLFTSAGTLSPKMLDTVYSFLDWDGWSGERVVLRPDSTIPAARLYAEQLDAGGAAKLFYSQNIFHFTDDGASREEWQCGVELIGDTGLAGDVELVLLALDTLTSLHLPPVTVRISHAGLVRSVLASAGMAADEQSAAYDRLLDGDLMVVGEIETRMPQLNAPLRLLFEVEGAGSAYLANVRSALAAPIPSIVPPLDDLAFVVAALEARGVAPVIQSVLARSFEYYSGLVFKMYAGGQRISSGGRYDELIRLIAAQSVPASGFAHYLSPMLALISEQDPRPIDGTVLVTSDGSDAGGLATTHAVASALRNAGFRAETVGRGATSGPRLTCRPDGAFRLVTTSSERTFSQLEDVIEAMEQGR